MNARHPGKWSILRKRHGQEECVLADRREAFVRDFYRERAEKLNAGTITLVNPDGAVVCSASAP